MRDWQALPRRGLPAIGGRGSPRVGPRPGRLPESSAPRAREGRSQGAPVAGQGRRWRGSTLERRDGAGAATRRGPPGSRRVLTAPRRERRGGASARRRRRVGGAARGCFSRPPGARRGLAGQWDAAAARGGRRRWLGLGAGCAGGRWGVEAGGGPSLTPLGAAAGRAGTERAGARGGRAAPTGRLAAPAALSMFREAKVFLPPVG